MRAQQESRYRDWSPTKTRPHRGWCTANITSKMVIRPTQRWVLVWANFCKTTCADRIFKIFHSVFFTLCYIWKFESQPHSMELSSPFWKDRTTAKWGFPRPQKARHMLIPHVAIGKDRYAHDSNIWWYGYGSIYLLIPFLGGWTSSYQLFWCSPGVQGFDPLPYYVIVFHLARL